MPWLQGPKRRTSVLEPAPSWLSCFSDLVTRCDNEGLGCTASPASVASVAVASVAVGRPLPAAGAAATAAAAAASCFLGCLLRPLGLAGASIPAAAAQGSLGSEDCGGSPMPL